ncbi:hypothetical protein H6F71_21545 [Microcoleus sp. FACHB-61]|nr:hypothetical protein [Microcoleus sp. FACHB-61]
MSRFNQLTGVNLSEIPQPSPLDQIKVDEWDQMIDVNEMIVRPTRQEL